MAMGRMPRGFFGIPMSRAPQNQPRVSAGRSPCANSSQKTASASSRGAASLFLFTASKRCTGFKPEGPPLDPGGKDRRSLRIREGSTSTLHGGRSTGSWTPAGRAGCKALSWASGLSKGGELAQRSLAALDRAPSLTAASTARRV